MPLEHFLIDPPIPLPSELDIVNKPQIRQRMNDGEPVLDLRGAPVNDIFIWVGSEHYPYCPDFIEEVRRYGASRRLSANLDLGLLSQESKMILAHARVVNVAWADQQLPESCAKHVAGHDDAAVPAGPCLFKLWDLIPQDAAVADIPAVEMMEERPTCLREIGSTVYSYRPTSEESRLLPGLFAALPITGFALIQFQDGTVNEKAKTKIVEGSGLHGERAVPFYETDR
jgi:hypothetical protein